MEKIEKNKNSSPKLYIIQEQKLINELTDNSDTSNDKMKIFSSFDKKIKNNSEPKSARY